MKHTFINKIALCALIKQYFENGEKWVLPLLSKSVKTNF